MVRRALVLASSVLVLAGAARAEQVTGWVLRAPTGDGYLLLADGANVYPVLGPKAQEVGAHRGRAVRVAGRVVARAGLVVEQVLEVGPPHSRVETVRGVVTLDPLSDEYVLLTDAGPVHVLRPVRDGPLPDVAQFLGRELEVEGLVRQRLVVAGEGDGTTTRTRAELIVERATSLERRELAGTVARDGDGLALDTPDGRVKLYSTPAADVAPGAAPSPLEDLLRRSVGAEVRVRGWALLGRDGRVEEVMAGAVKAQAGDRLVVVTQDGSLRELGGVEPPPPAPAAPADDRRPRGPGFVGTLNEVVR